MLKAKLITLLSLPLPFVEGHGYLYSPRSRNWVAHEDGTDSWSGSGTSGTPTKEYCYHCLNTKATNEICGSTSTNNYDSWLDQSGQPIPWNSQATYTEGDTITIKSFLSTNHKGHMDLFVCSDGDASTQACFESNPLEFVEDVSHSAPKDVNYPNRGYYKWGVQDFEMKFKLPVGVTGDKVMMQWRYVTGNSCISPGYLDYPWPDPSWLGGNHAECSYPLDPTGARCTGCPEQFWNCAEITILPSNGSLPTSSPIASSPTSSPIASSPNSSPVSFITDSFSCTENGISSISLLSFIDELTYTVSESPKTLAFLAEGGAAGSGGSVVSEGQGYGLLTSAITLASLDISDSNRNSVIEKFYGYFNGWKKMCINSSPSPCQSPEYCTHNGGKAPCLPGWKHNGDLSTVEGTGSAPDGDEDAILGMIIAIKALEQGGTLPSWYDELRQWTDESCTQFLMDNTALSSSGSHRLLKLGSCWGGWNGDGNNPSYHSPGAYRAMRDYHTSYDGMRNYAMPNFGDSLSLTEKWNMLIDTSYKFFSTTQCSDTGLVPNWALVREVDSENLEKQSGSFSGSGTPQYEFGAEASRTIWRVAIDAIFYPAESYVQASYFLDPLHEKLLNGFIESSETWDQNTLQTCSYVTAVFNSWQYNGFIFGPVYSALAAPSLSMSSTQQQQLVNAACDDVGTISSSESYYPKSWKVISMMTLNGDVAKVGALLRNDEYSPSPTVSGFIPPTPSPTPVPTPLPTPSPSLPANGACGCRSRDGMNQPECIGNTEERCNQMINNEGKCKWVDCTATTMAPTQNIITPSPTYIASGCYSNNYKDCLPDGFDVTESSCNQVWLPNGARKNCLALWSECTGNTSGCCGAATCYGDSSYASCVPYNT